MHSYEHNIKQVEGMSSRSKQEKSEDLHGISQGATYGMSHIRKKQQWQT
jgi:hypothetical protein